MRNSPTFVSSHHEVPRRRSERGETKVGCALWLLVALVIAMIGWKAVPVRIDVSTLTDFMVEQAQFATQRTTSNQIQSRILKRAKELELPIRKSDIKVRKTASRVVMECSFMVPLEFPFYTYEWVFDLRIDRPLFII